MRQLSRLGAAALTAALAACGITYQYDGRPYESAAAGLAAAREAHEKIVAQTPVASNRVGGTLNFYSPDKASILERGIRKTGEPSPQILDYVAEISLTDYRGLYNALVKRGSFDRVVFHYSDGQHVPAKAGEYAVYLYQPNVDRIGWFFASDTVKQHPLQFDMSKAERAERIRYWLDSIDALARVK
jgi:hypothetical protein